MIYVDDTTIVAMVRRTDDGRALARALNADFTRLVLTSTLSEIVVGSALGPAQAQQGRSLLRRVSRYEIDAQVRRTATEVGGELDTAIHVATALVVLGELCTGFATTAPERAAVARAHGLPLLTPDRVRTPPACR